MRFSIFETQAVKDDASRFDHRSLVVRMDLEHAELAFNDLRAGSGLGGFDGDIHRAEDLIAGRHLDVQGSHTLGREVTLCHGSNESRVLRLHAVQVTITT